MATLAAPAINDGVGTNIMGLDTQMFTRGTGDDKPRGESMVQKHLEKMQQERENLAMQKLAALMPQFGTAVRVMALKECAFDLDAAVSMLRAFQTANDEELKALQKKRKKLQDAEAEAVKKAQEAAEQQKSDSSSDSEESSSSGSGSDESNSSGSDSDDSDRDRKKRRRDNDKKKKRSSKGKKEKSKKRKKDADKDRKKKKRRKDDEKASGKSLTASENFGRFGFLRETDAHSKRNEFVLWALDVKKVDVESMGRIEEKELLKDFIEDFNTGTLPHRKYYNLEIYEREKAAKQAAKYGKRAEKVAKAKSSALQDEEAYRRQREAERAKLAEERTKQALFELQATDKAKDMREQELLKLQMQTAYKTGDTKKAQQILERLMPEEERKAKGLR